MFEIDGDKGKIELKGYNNDQASMIQAAAEGAAKGAAATQTGGLTPIK